MSKDTINIYWSYPVLNSDPLDWNLIVEEPLSVYSDLIPNINRDNEKDNFFICPSFKNHTKSTIVFKNPIDSGYRFESDGRIADLRKASIPASFHHDPSLNNNLIFNYRMPMLFFCDEDVDMTLTAPYFHNAPHMRYGAVIPGSFNVGSWFRVAQMEFNLWNGMNEFYLAEGEPMAYFNFHTDKTIKLHRFRTTETLEKITSMCAMGPMWEPRVPLTKRYKRFKASKTNEVVLSEIKKNLM